VIVIHPKYFRGPRHRGLRVSAFVALGLSGFIPIVHGLRIYGLDRMWRASGLPYYLLEGGILGAGALCYAMRFPESTAALVGVVAGAGADGDGDGDERAVGWKRVGEEEEEEEMTKGRYDMCGNSHNLFHVLVVLAEGVHFVGVWHAFGYNYRHVRCVA
jgi:adiponectin receptor